MPLILTIKEAEVGELQAKPSLGQKRDTLYETTKAKGLGAWLSVEYLSPRKKP
jgi:hypothetical protein